MSRLGKYVIGKAVVGSQQLIPKSHPSECVASLEYDIDNQQMTIHFNERGSYVYFDVDPGTFAEINTSSMRGEYFNLYVRGRYQYERVA